MASGLIDADLGGGIVKKPVAQPGHGKRGNIAATELKALQKLARDLLGFDAAKLDVLVEQSLIEEICHDRQDQNA